MRISDWSSDVCSSDLYTTPQMLSGKSPDWLRLLTTRATASWPARVSPLDSKYTAPARHFNSGSSSAGTTCACTNSSRLAEVEGVGGVTVTVPSRSEAHTSELQSLMRISYAVF